MKSDPKTPAHWSPLVFTLFISLWPKDRQVKQSNRRPMISKTITCSGFINVHLLKLFGFTPLRFNSMQFCLSENVLTTKTPNSAENLSSNDVFLQADPDVGFALRSLCRFPMEVLNWGNVHVHAVHIVKEEI